MTEILLGITAVMSIIAFIMMGVDKSLARHNKRRISEKALMLSALLMGGVGAYVGMYTFRHKTKHLKFTLGVPLIIVLNIAIIIAASKFA
ncbi:MAG: DUF1294 domain-containing protein [Clostridia bacterium]|nr:DUF1294 domain-containing protein [Clostridia bacterium]